MVKACDTIPLGSHGVKIAIVQGMVLGARDPERSKTVLDVRIHSLQTTKSSGMIVTIQAAMAIFNMCWKFIEILFQALFRLFYLNLIL